MSSRRCKACDSAKGKEYNARPEVMEKRRETDAVKSKQRKVEVVNETGYCVLPSNAYHERIKYKARRYNTTYMEMIDLHNQTNCAICDVVFEKTGGSRRDIDHCHTTNTARGALCHRCNITLGKIEAGYNLPSLQQFTDYLHQSITSTSTTEAV